MRNFKLFFILILFYFFSQPISSFSQQCIQNVTVGSSVGIPNLQTALSQGVLVSSPADGKVITSFCVKGVFDINVNKTFFDIDIEIQANSKITLSSTSSLSVEGRFEECHISGDPTSSRIEVSRVTGNTDVINKLSFYDSKVKNLYITSVKDFNAFITGYSTDFTDIRQIQVNSTGTFYSYDDTFFRSRIEVNSGGTFFAKLSNFSMDVISTSLAHNCVTLLNNTKGYFDECTFNDSSAGIYANAFSNGDPPPSNIRIHER